MTNVEKSIYFYHHILGMKLHASWKNGTYLTCGTLWVCLLYDPQRYHVDPETTDYTHYAFSVTDNDFPLIVEKLQLSGVNVWKDNRSEGASFYFLDPDRHKLEIHVGSLAERLKSCNSRQ